LTERNPITVPAPNGLIRFHGERIAAVETGIWANSASFFLAEMVATIIIENVAIVAFFRWED